MTTPAPDATELDVLGLGNAIVDVLSEADDRTLERLDLAKGTMTLVDEARMAELYGGIGPAVEMSGGSCANTMAALASLGARAAYVGKVQRDQLGEVFTHDIRARASTFRTAAPGRWPADRALPHPGHAGRAAHDGDLPRRLRRARPGRRRRGPRSPPPGSPISRAISGTGRTPRQACLKAAELAHRHGRQVALTLSDPFCVGPLARRVRRPDRAPRRHPDRQRGRDLQPVWRRPASRT